MDKSNNINVFLTDLGNTLREVSGSIDPINPQDFSTKIRELGNNQIPVNVKSTATLSGAEVSKIKRKSQNLSIAVSDTFIDNEKVYKMDQRQNEDSFDLFDTCFYTEEADKDGSYYLFNASDNYLSKENLIYNPSDSKDINQIITHLNAISKNGYKMTSVSKVENNKYTITFEDGSNLTISRNE